MEGSANMIGYGLAAILAFIGVKLLFHALHVNEVPFINGGEPIDWIPEIPIWFSLGFILLTIAVATVLTLIFLPALWSSPSLSSIPPLAIVCTTCTPFSLSSRASVCASCRTEARPAPYAANCALHRNAPSVPVKISV